MNFFGTMSIWASLGLAMIGLAVIIAVLSFLLYARKKMTDSFGMIWWLIAMVLGALGIILMVVEHDYNLICMIVAAICILLLTLIFITSRMVSELMMKVRELAMQVALLNQENDSILRELKMLEEKNTDE